MSVTTLAELLESAFEPRAELIALGDVVISRCDSEFASYVEDWAGELARVGVRRGGWMTLRLESRPEWIELACAAAHLEAVLVPRDPRFQPGGDGYFLRYSRAKALFVEGFAKCRCRRCWGDVFPCRDRAKLSGPKLPGLTAVNSLSGASEPPQSGLAPDGRRSAEDTTMLAVDRRRFADAFFAGDTRHVVMEVQAGRLASSGGGGIAARRFTLVNLRDEVVQDGDIPMPISRRHSNE